MRSLLSTALLALLAMSAFPTADATSYIGTPTGSNNRLTTLDDIFPPGTLTYMEFGDCDCWYMGTITGFDQGSYTVDWDDGDESIYAYTDLSKVSKMVASAARFVSDASNLGTVTSRVQVYPVNTPVYYRFDDGWYSGTISSFAKDTGTYTVTWNDSTTTSPDTTQHTDVRQVLTMVQQAANQAIYSGNEKGLLFDVGESVYFQFPERWYEGKITAMSGGSNGDVYTVNWDDDDGAKDLVTYGDTMRMKQMVDEARIFDVEGLHKPLQVFPIGTRTYKEWVNDGWYNGQITGFSRGTYTVTWSDGTSNDYGGLKEVLEMVTDAANEIEEKSPNTLFFPVGTMLYYHFNDGWYSGRINGFVEGNYKVAWGDFTGYYYTNAQQVLQMVTQAAEVILGEQIPVYQINTPVYYKFPDMWYEGYISAFDTGSGKYTVTWSDDSTSHYTDGTIVKQMVDQAVKLSREKNTPAPTPRPPTDAPKVDEGPILYLQKIAAGSKVYKEFPEGWYEGIITGWDEGEYEVTYSDKSVYYYSDEDEVRQMVNDAANIPEQNVGDGSSSTPTEKEPTKQEFAIDTPVYQKFSDGWYDGRITAYDSSNGEYEVTYADNTIFYYTDVEEVRKMVEQAEDTGFGTIAAASSGGGGGGGIGAAGVAVIVIAVIVAMVAAVFFFLKKRDQKEDKIPGIPAAPTSDTNLAPSSFHEEDLKPTEDVEII